MNDAAAVTVPHAETGGDDENRQQRHAAARRAESQTQLGLAAVMTTTNTHEISNDNAHNNHQRQLPRLHYR